MQQSNRETESINRYKEICKYKDYIRKENRTSKYGYYTCDMYVRKDIPVHLTMYEIAKYADDWNYCFGGNIMYMNETETERIYRVNIYTD